MLWDPDAVRRGFRAIAFLLLTSTAFSCSPDAPSDSSVASEQSRIGDSPARTLRPNVVLVVLDTTRASALSAYGNAKPTTPNFDRLAAEGTLFNRAMATDFWTLPTHASLLTGLYPSDHGATSETNALPKHAETLAERLKREGWSTGAFVSNTWVSAERGFDRGFEVFSESWRGAGSVKTQVIDRRTLREASIWIEKQHASNRPFFAMLNLNGAHMPYAPDTSVRLKFSPESYPPTRAARAREIVGMWKSLAGELVLDDLDYQIMREYYEAEIHMVDRLVGRLVKRLVDLGIHDETLIIVTADHGENIGEHGRIDHLFSMHETTIHIPLVVRYPARFTAGRVDTDLASQVDVMPTVLDVLGLANGDADVITRSLANPEREAPAFVIAENDRPINGIELMERKYPDFDTTTIDHRVRMLRTDRYKLIWRSNAAVELFDLESDPVEAHDVSDQIPDIRNELLAQLEEWMQSREVQDAASFDTTDPESLEQLKALGYIE